MANGEGSSLEEFLSELRESLPETHGEIIAAAEEEVTLHSDLREGIGISGELPRGGDFEPPEMPPLVPRRYQDGPREFLLLRNAVLKLLHPVEVGADAAAFFLDNEFAGEENRVESLAIEPFREPGEFPVLDRESAQDLGAAAAELRDILVQVIQDTFGTEARLRDFGIYARG